MHKPARPGGRTEFRALAAGLRIPLAACACVAMLGCYAADRPTGQKGKSMKSMNCTTVSAEEFKRAVLEAQARMVYRPASGKVSAKMRMEIAIPGVQAEAEKETFMVIHSGRLEASVFAGPYSEVLQVAIDDRLMNDHGADTLRFEYYRKALQQICFWEQDSAEPYWQPNSTAKVQFLDARQIDDRTGRARAFTVQISAKL